MKRIIQKAKELITVIESQLVALEKCKRRCTDQEERRVFTEQIDQLSEMLNKLNDFVCELPENA